MVGLRLDRQMVRRKLGAFANASLLLLKSICRWLRYRYIRAPLFVIENQYDTNQIFTQELVPKAPASAAESAAAVS